jgi:hypothetical protein
MRLYTNEKEAPTLIEALTKYIADGFDKCGRAQELLLRIQKCLELQGYERKSSDSD